MKNYFPPIDKNFGYLQTNRSDDLGSIWASFNLDFQTKLGTLRLTPKLVSLTTSSDDADLGLPVAFEFWYDEWWAICGTRLFKNGAPDLITAFAEETGIAYAIGSPTTQFDVTNPAGLTFRYTYDATGTDPKITALTFPIGATVVITDTNLAAGNRGTFTVTGSGSNYFEVTNAAGVVESNKTISTGSITVTGGSFGQDYSQYVSDMRVFNDKLWVTSSQHLRSRQADSAAVPWLNVALLNSTSAIHKLEYFKKFDRLYFVDQSTGIYSVDTSDVVATSGNYTLNPGKSIGFISTMVANSSFIWIGSFRDVLITGATDSEVKGAISQWDGYSNQVANEYPIEAGGVLAMCVVDDIPYALDSEGRVLAFAGYGFKEVARLPIERTLLVNPTAFGVARFVHFNGMVATKNNTIQILINNLNDDAAGDVTENLPSGIWELDLATANFTHRSSPTLKSLASSTITDYGQSRIYAPGALKMNYLQSNAAGGRGTVISGFGYYSDASTVKYGIFIDSPNKPTTSTEGQKRGYATTTFFFSGEITDIWSRVWAVFKRFLAEADKITIKFRFDEEDPVLANITWLSTTQFETTTDVSAYAPDQSPFDGTIGGEVEVLQGTGAGSCTHISEISENAGTYTVTLDTAVTGVAGTAKARFQKWRKVLPEITGQTLNYGSCDIGQNDTKIQLKLVFEWTGDGELQKMVLYSGENINSDS